MERYSCRPRRRRRIRRTCTTHAAPVAVLRSHSAQPRCARPRCPSPRQRRRRTPRGSAHSAHAPCIRRRLHPRAPIRHLRLPAALPDHPRDRRPLFVCAWRGRLCRRKSHRVANTRDRSRCSSYAPYAAPRGPRAAAPRAFAPGVPRCAPARAAAAADRRCVRRVCAQACAPWERARRCARCCGAAAGA